MKSLFEQMGGIYHEENRYLILNLTLTTEEEKSIVIWAQRVVRFYDSDKHIIEVGENLKVVCQRFLNTGMTPEQVAKCMDVCL